MITFSLSADGILAGPLTVFTINSIELTPDHLSTKALTIIRARVTTWLSLSNEVKECDWYLKVFEIMPYEIGKHQIVLGLISSITQMRSKKALFFCYFMK